jgi:aminoglycoside phosphotransferase (APT) family kinase protein
VHNGQGSLYKSYPPVFFFHRICDGKQLLPTERLHERRRLQSSSSQLRRAMALKKGGQPLDARLNEWLKNAWAEVTRGASPNPANIG